MTFWGVKGLARRAPRRPRCSPAARATFDFGGGPLHPYRGVILPPQKFRLTPHAYKKKCWCNLTTENFFYDPELYLKGSGGTDKQFAEI